jgi:hypothetical protein
MSTRRLGAGDSGADHQDPDVLPRIGKSFDKRSHQIGVAQLWDMACWHHLQPGVGDERRGGPRVREGHHGILITPDHERRHRESPQVLRSDAH